jgi:hypothetical protein
MSCANVLLVLTSCAFAQTASFEGVATHAITHEPLSGVHIQLIGVRNLAEGDLATYGAVSDRAGHFSLAPLPAGSYILTPEYRGFLYTQPKEGAVPMPSVTLKAGER